MATISSSSAPGTPTRSSQRATSVALVLLGLATGAADAFAFLLLGGTFTANMTGNLILLGMFTRPGWIVTLAGALTAIIAFAGAAYVGFRVSPKSRADAAYPQRAVLTLTVPSLVLQLALALIWLIADANVSAAGTCGLIAISAAALGAQTVLAKRISGAAGLTTTFVTGTLTTVMQELAEGQRGSRAIQLAVVAALTLGAFAGTAVAAALPLAGPLVPFGLFGAATLFLTGRGAPQ